MTYMLASILAVLFIVIIVIINDKRKGHSPVDYITGGCLKVGFKHVSRIANNKKLDNTKGEVFNLTRDKIIQEITVLADELSIHKRVDIEDAVFMGLVSYSDLALLYSYTLETENEELFVFYRHNNKSRVDEMFKKANFPICNFE